MTYEVLHCFDTMARPRSKIDITCQNSSCNYYLAEKGKDIIKRGKNGAGNQQYFCKHCRSWFVETVNTPLYYKHLPLPEIAYICYLLSCGYSIRHIAKMTDHNRNTICYLLDDLVVNPTCINNIFLKESLMDQSKINRLWSAILTKKKSLSKEARNHIRKLISDPKIKI
jgi:transposase-like protein